MTNKHQKEVVVEMIVGFFMLTAITALIYFTAVLSHKELFKSSYNYEVVFSEVGGLHSGDNVVLRGMTVGRIGDVQLKDRKVLVSLILSVPLELHKGYQIDVVDSSMLGGKNLRIYEGLDTEPILGEGEVIRGNTPLNMIAELGEAVGGLKKMVVSIREGEGALGKLMRNPELYDNINETAENLKIITGKIKAGEGTLGRLMMDDQVYTDLVKISANVKNLTDRLEKGEGSIGKLLTDDGQLYVDARKTLSNLQLVSSNLAEGKGTLGKLMAEDDTVYTDLAATLASIRRISESIDKGEGTLGKLVRDAKLYDETTLLVEDVRAAVDDLREASPITSFGSVIFGAF